MTERISTLLVGERSREPLCASDPRLISSIHQHNQHQHTNGYDMKTILSFIIMLSAATAQTQYSSTWGEFNSGNGTSQTSTTTHQGMFSGWLSHSMQSAHYTMRHGSPSLPIPVPTSDVPNLTIALIRGNVRVSWPTAAADFVLETNSDVANADSWTTVMTPYLNDGSESFILVPTEQASRFYRLVSP
jgi:hypothetical protein